MNPRWQKIREAFRTLVDLPEDERRAELDRLAAHDSDLADKVTKLRVFPDENGKTNKSLTDIGGSILSISQFTLYADAKEGNRPSFVKAMPGKDSEPLYALFNNMLKERGFHVETGVFGADMKVHLVNDGPFTLWLDSEELKK